MKILYIHQYFNTYKDAGGSRSYSFAKRLVQRGHNVIMLTSNRENKSSKLFEKRCVEGFDVIYIKNKYFNSMSFIARIFSFLKFMLLSTFVSFRIQNIDIVFATSTPLTVGIPGMLLKCYRKVPFVFEVRDLWPKLAISMNILRNRLLIAVSEWLEKKIYFLSDHVIALAPGIKKEIVGKKYPSDKVTMIPNGSDIELFQKSKCEKRRRLPVKEDDFVLIYTGAHGIANGLQYVINIAKEAIKRNYKDIKFVLIGDGKLKPILVEQKSKYNLDNIIFLDPIPKTEITKYIREADIGMQLLANHEAFYYGTSPNKFFDYLAAGKPVLNNYPGWVANMICEYHCGMVVDPDDYEGFFNKINILRENKDELEQMGKNARKLAEKKFDRAKLAVKFVKVLESVYNNHVSHLRERDFNL